MDNIKQKICKEFETEAFLFLDNDLPDGKIKIFKEHLAECVRCKTYLEEINIVSNGYGSIPLNDVEESAFNSMINTAAGSSLISFSKKRENISRGKSLVEVFGFYRLTFGSAIVAAAIIVLIISFFNNPVIEKTIPQQLMDWDGEHITKRIENVENRILSLKTEEWDIYIVRKNEKENWNSAVNSIRQQIIKMKKNADKKEL